MINPLINNLSEFTATQLEEKITDLQRKYFQTRNPQLQHQIVSTLEMFREELRERRTQELKRQQEQMNRNGDKGLDNLINVS